jgi:hypothetical protein
MSLWQGLHEFTPVLGPWGTGVVFAVILAQSVINFFAWRRSNEASHLRGAVAAMKAELDVYHGKTDRQDVELKELRTEVNALTTLEADCRRQLAQVTAWYLEEKGGKEEKDDRAPRKRT